MKSKFPYLVIFLSIGIGCIIYLSRQNYFVNLIPSGNIDSTASRAIVNSEIKQENKSPKRQKKKKRPEKNNAFSKVDQIARQTPKSKEKSIGELARYFSSKANNDYEKARMAYTWITQHISYDDGGYNAGEYGDVSVAAVFSSRKSVCEGFSNLYKALCDSMGLKAVKVLGYAKGYSYSPGITFNETNHAWNAVFIEGKWRLVDVTWGEGYGKTVKNKLKAVKKFDPFWFDTDPYAFLFKHLPEKQIYQLIDKPISKSQYEKLVDPDKAIFELGVSAKTILKLSLNNPKFRPPEAWTRDYDIRLLQSFLFNEINSSKEYEFKIVCNEDVDITFINENKWVKFNKVNNEFYGAITPEKGELKVSVRLKDFEDSYWPILKYQVK